MSQELSSPFIPTLVLSPNGRLFIENIGEKPASELIKTFAISSAAGLLYLDGSTSSITETSVFAYWKDFTRFFLTRFVSTADLEAHDIDANPIKVEFPQEDLERFIAMAPPMKGSEYIDNVSLVQLWDQLNLALHADIKSSGQKLPDYFSSRHGAHNLLGRVCFHLAENKGSIETPFAFLATYARNLSAEGRTQHVPLSRALEEYGGSKNKTTFLRLLLPVQRASKESAFIKELIESGDLYQTLAWNPRDAHRFLKDIPILERSGIAVRVPNWWKPKHPTRPQVSIKLGEKKPNGIGLNALVDFSMSVVLGEQELSQKEIHELLSASENLIFFKGQWIEIDKEKLGNLLDNWKKTAGSVSEGLSFGEAVRLISGVESGILGQEPDDEKSFTRIISGKWLTDALEENQNPENLKKIEDVLKKNLHAELRPYQKQGALWLYRLNQLRLGGILADDMGLGKTIQVISLLLLRQKFVSNDQNLLVVPASLIGNWKSELTKFAPSIRFWIAHGSGDGYAAPSFFKSPEIKSSSDVSLVITTYGSLLKLKWLLDHEWGTLVADEAQAIKNPTAKQTKALKSLKAQHRLALTGTPVENHLSDLWSLFDFASPGLLGSVKGFETFMKKKAKSSESPYAPLRRLVKPYILRRLKTDKRIIQDLPEKTELKTFCSLSAGQAALYQKSVETLIRDIKEAEGIKRRGIILSYLMRFKQICNHPSQFVKDERFAESDSGKFQRLREICEVIREKQEKVLIFTQFKEITSALHTFLKGIFGSDGLVLHGEIPVNKRSKLVEDFQREGGPSFFVLSLKAGGTGLNLTAASHVIHFDRWWNPATENQATDRAFRIGQKRNVLVHKFICKGTLEEKIDAMIDSKRSVSNEILEDSQMTMLTELASDELIKLVSLDINSAMFD